MPLIEINGSQLWVEESGAGPETIVFAHGLLLSGDLRHAWNHHACARDRSARSHHDAHTGPAWRDRHRDHPGARTPDADGISGAEMHIIPRAGHSSTLEEPAALADAIEAFVQK